MLELAVLFLGSRAEQREIEQLPDQAEGIDDVVVAAGGERQELVLEDLAPAGVLWKPQAHRRDVAAPGLRADRLVEPARELLAIGESEELARAALDVGTDAAEDLPALFSPAERAVVLDQAAPAVDPDIGRHALAPDIEQPRPIVGIDADDDVHGVIAAARAR